MNCVVSNAVASQNTTIPITDTNIYIPVVTLSTQEYAEQIKSGFKRTINWNKYYSKTEPLNALNSYLDILIEPSFQRLKILFVLPYHTLDSRTAHSKCHLPTAKVEDYNVMIMFL